MTEVTSVTPVDHLTYVAGPGTRVMLTITPTTGATGKKSSLTKIIMPTTYKRYALSFAKEVPSKPTNGLPSVLVYTGSVK